MASEKKITIGDVAAAAGVSKATVSRYINGNVEHISPATQERIGKVIRLTNYTPNDIARNLKKATTNLIGVTISDISSPFSSSLVLGVGDYLERKGYTPLFINCNDNPASEQTAIQSLIAKGVSGLLINTTSYENDFLVGLAARGMPIVLCDRYVKNYVFDIVTNQSAETIRQLLQHLKDVGYTRVAFFSQKWDNNSSRFLRMQAFLQCAKDIFGYSPQGEVYPISSKNDSLVCAGLENFLGKLSPHDRPAVLGVNSITTIQLFNAIHKYHLSVPEQIGLCGPEDWGWKSVMNWPELVSPTITTVVFDPIDLGQKAAELLLAKLGDPNLPRQEIFIPSHLSIRQSTLLRA